MTSSICNNPVQRDQLEYALVSGAAIILAQDPSNANYIAAGIKNVLDALHPRDVAGEPLKAAAIAVPELSPSAQADQSIEAEIQAKGLTAPRVTPRDIEANIEGEFYFTAGEGCESASDDAASQWVGIPEECLDLLTFCVIVLRNGFTVTGESACASPENFDAELGRKIARQNAINKVWPLMDYELRSKLAAQAA